MLKIARDNVRSPRWQHLTHNWAHIICPTNPSSRQCSPAYFDRLRRQCEKALHASCLVHLAPRVNDRIPSDKNTTTEDDLRIRKDTSSAGLDRIFTVNQGPGPQGQSGKYLEEFARLLPSKIDFKRKPSLKPRRIKSFQPKLVQTTNGNDMDSERLQNATNHPYNDWRTAFDILKKTPPLHALNNKDGSKEPERENNYRKVAWYGQSHHNLQTAVQPKRPRTWTESSFASYVRALVEYNPPARLLHELLLLKGDKGKPLTRDDQIRLLDKIFYEPYLRNCVSIEAGNDYLQFLYSQARLPEARALFLRLEHLFGELPVATWNIVLRASASNRSLYNFTFQLEKMIGRRIQPDADTWISMLMLLPSADARREVLAVMHSNGLMQNFQARREVANHMCLEDYHEHHSLRSNPQPFFEFMDQKYGRDWASTSAINKLLGELLLRSSSGPKIAALYRALILLHQMKQRAFVVNGVTLDIFLNALTQIGREDLIIEILDIFRNHWRLEPDGQAHRRLFEYGWRRRKYNFLRTVWISACLKGLTNSWMRYLVLQSMISYKKSSVAKDAGENFRSTIGWFLTSVHRTKSLTKMLTSNEDSIPRHVCHLALKSSIATFGQGRFRRPLVAALRKSLEIDSNWDFFRALSQSQQDNNNIQKDQIEIIKTRSYERIGRKSVNELNRRLRQRKYRSAQFAST